MPEISRFFGILIAMFHNDHQPPHFHVRYGSERAIVDIESLTVLRGTLGPRVRGLVTEWAAAHQDELRDNWQRARSHQSLEPIKPLE